MEKQEKEFPYNFNVMREYKIYKNIGNIQNNLLKLPTPIGVMNLEKSIL